MLAVKTPGAGASGGAAAYVVGGYADRLQKVTVVGALWEGADLGFSSIFHYRCSRSVLSMSTRKQLEHDPQARRFA